jgi:hypothetical protein
MNISRRTKGLVILAALVSCFFFLSRSPIPAATKRGDAPHCQEECTAHHGERMRQLSEEYLKTGNKMGYQDSIEEETLNYSRCLTNCRDVLPIK